MKPTSTIARNRRSFPLVEWNYQPPRLTEFDEPILNDSTAPCVKASKSLRTISRDYFDAEANREFMSEAAVFTTLIIIAMVPIVSGASAVLNLLHALPLF